MGRFIVPAVVFLLAALPLGILLTYGSEGVRVVVNVGPVPFLLYPRKKKEKKPTAKPESKSETKPEPQKSPEPQSQPSQPAKEERPQNGGSPMDFLPLVKTGLDLLCDLRRKIRVKELYLRWILASSDPADLAIHYGRAWTALGNLMPRLEQLFVIRKRDVEVECDFTASESKCVARLDVTITLGRALVLVAVYGIRALKEYRTIQTKRKGGAAL